MKICVPVFASAQDQDIRLKIVEDLFPFGITGVFMLGRLGFGMSKDEQQEERTRELAGYLADYFANRDQKLGELSEYKSAAELKQRREKAAALMDEVEKLKSAGELDKAIALCRQAAETLPSDPEAYLEGGRLLVKQRKYPPAMQMFRDAESVAEALPAPSQEIGNLRVLQVKDHLAQRAAAGMKPDVEMVNQYLAEAVESFGTAMQKASSLVTADPEKQKAKREEALATVTDNILTLGLAETVGGGNPHVKALGGLVSEVLEQRIKSGDQMSPRLLIQMGLMAFFNGELDKAETTLFKAAKDPEVSYEAQVKINYMATQLRQRGNVQRAIRVYERLLQLTPSEKGVVLFNLGAAQETLARNFLDKEKKPHTSLQMQAMCNSVEAVYTDPSLPLNPNFYLNTVLASGLLRASKTFRALLDAAQDQETPTDKACREATEKLESLLGNHEERKALDLMFSMAGSLRPYFLAFDKHASDQVAQFASQLHPKLLKHPNPKMQIFGKVLGVLVDRARQATSGRPAFRNQEVNKVFDALEMGDQPLAAHELTKCVLGDPQLPTDLAFTGNRELMNLAREINMKLAKVDFKRFQNRAA